MNNIFVITQKTIKIVHLIEINSFKLMFGRQQMFSSCSFEKIVKQVVKFFITSYSNN